MAAQEPRDHVVARRPVKAARLITLHAGDFLLGIAGMAAVQKVRCKTRELVHERRGAHRIGKQGNCVFKSMRECRRGYLPPDEFFSFEGQVILHLWIRW